MNPDFYHCATSASVDASIKKLALPLFCYGTLQSKSVYKKVTGTEWSTSRDAILKGHGRRTVKDAIYPGITASPDNEVVGILVDATTATLAKLDQFEGDQYERRIVKVQVLETGEIVDSFVYYFLNEQDLSDQEWNLSDFKPF